jgi:hypothetical protein
MLPPAQVAHLLHLEEVRAEFYRRHAPAPTRTLADYIQQAMAVAAADEQDAADRRWARFFAQQGAGD